MEFVPPRADVPRAGRLIDKTQWSDPPPCRRKPDRGFRVVSFNLKAAAQSIGVEIQQSLLLRADA